MCLRDDDDDDDDEYDNGHHHYRSVEFSYPISYHYSLFVILFSSIASLLNIELFKL
jgi:hypothetical protein